MYSQTGDYLHVYANSSTGPNYYTISSNNFNLTSPIVYNSYNYIDGSNQCHTSINNDYNLPLSQPYEGTPYNILTQVSLNMPVALPVSIK